MLTLC
jgi:hypothetical protein